MLGMKALRALIEHWKHERLVREFYSPEQIAERHRLADKYLYRGEKPPASIYTLKKLGK